MSDFPNTKLESLAYLYLQKIDTSGLSPVQFLAKYEEIYRQMADEKKNGHKTVEIKKSPF